MSFRGIGGVDYELLKKKYAEALESVTITIDNPPNLDIPLSRIDSRLYDTSEAKTITDVLKELRDRTATETTLAAIRSQTDKLLFDSNSFLRIALASDELGLLKTADLDLDASKRLGVRIEVDNVGIATESTLSSILSKLDTNLSTRASETTLSSIKSQTDKLSFDTNSNLLININADSVGLLKTTDLSFDANGYLNINAQVVANPPNLDIALSQLDSDLKARLPREIVLDDGTGSYAPLYRSGNALLISVGEDKIGLAKDDTVNSLKGSDNRTLTDIYNSIVADQPRHITNAYDSANDWFKISLANDAVGLAKDATLQQELTRIAKLRIYDDTLATPAWVDLTRSILRESRIIADDVGLARDSTLQSILAQLDVALSTRASEDTLSAIKSQTDKLSFDASNNLLISVNADTVGLAKDTTLVEVRDRLPAELTTNGNFKTAIVEDLVGLLKDGGNVNIANWPSDFPDTGTHSRLDTIDADLKTNLPRKLVADDGTGAYGEIYRTGNNLNIQIKGDDVGLARDSTVSGLKGADGRTLTDVYNAIAGDQPRHITNAYDSVNDRFKVAVESTVNPPNLDIALSTVDSDLKSRLPRELELDDGTGTYGKIYRTGNNLNVQIKGDDSGILKTADLNIDANKNLLVGINVDNVGLLKKSDLSFDASGYLNVNAQVVANPPNLDVALSTRASETTLQAVRDRLPSSLTTNGNFKTAIAEDLVGLATESTLSGIKTQTDKLVFDANSNLKIDIAADDVGIAKDSTVAGLKGADNRTLTDLYNAVVGDQPRHITNAYDSTNDRFKISIENDNVGLLKEGGNVNVANFPTDYPDSGTHSRLDDLRGALASIGSDKLLTTPDNPPNLDIALSAHRDALKPDRGSPSQDLSAYSIAAGGVAEITKSNLSGWSALVVTVKATYDANATSGVRVRWLYSPDGTNFDSPEDAEDQGNYEDLTFSAGATRQRTIIVPIVMPYVKIQVVNLDASYAVTVDAWTTPMR